ncbi:SDR family oxidoreductase [Anoxynatronum buryatiense]|uniref:2-deoxy-D-gluconate 3-dehydrogenase n=1 Tax=Anoxynatronum buryatiense TaxID=489973 RepID=A0AA45WT33_9CLOT|nr:SDR family oxidoreductase [Anoxynatronum buryatiense]SMP39851.1 2-deoxy-D-gluconate 3-dehydrogenase [Anoxynatronum buryatiense]
MQKMFDLTGKTAVVTGGSRGLGKAMVKALAGAGANVAIIATKIPDELMDEMALVGTKIKGYSFNLGEFDKYDELVNQIVEDFGQVDILVNNAGVQRRHPSTEFPKEDWDFVMEINSSAVFFMCQRFGKLMVERGRGKIINLASLLSFQGGLTVPAYAASKGAVMQLTKSLANEWASKGVNVNCIAPGYMDTDMNMALVADEERNKQILQRIPAGRWGQAEDMMGTVVFLASEASNYIHGYTIAVDGGWMGR